MALAQDDQDNVRVATRSGSPSRCCLKATFSWAGPAIARALPPPALLCPNRHAGGPDDSTRLRPESQERAVHAGIERNMPNPARAKTAKVGVWPAFVWAVDAFRRARWVDALLSHRIGLADGEYDRQVRAPVSGVVVMAPAAPTLMLAATKAPVPVGERRQHQRPPRPRAPSPRPRSQAITPPAPHPAAPLEPQAQPPASPSLTLRGGSHGSLPCRVFGGGPRHGATCNAAAATRQFHAD